MNYIRTIYTRIYHQLLSSKLVLFVVHLCIMFVLVMELSNFNTKSPIRDLIFDFAFVNREMGYHGSRHPAYLPHRRRIQNGRIVDVRFFGGVDMPCQFVIDCNFCQCCSNYVDISQNNSLYYKGKVKRINSWKFENWIGDRKWYEIDKYVFRKIVCCCKFRVVYNDALAMRDTVIRLTYTTERTTTRILNNIHISHRNGSLCVFDGFQ